jgi:hypothetical protein
VQKTTRKRPENEQKATKKRAESDQKATRTQPESNQKATSSDRSGLTGSQVSLVRSQNLEHTPSSGKIRKSMYSRILKFARVIFCKINREFSCIFLLFFLLILSLRWRSTTPKKYSLSSSLRPYLPLSYLISQH